MKVSLRFERFLARLRFGIQERRAGLNTRMTAGYGGAFFIQTMPAGEIALLILDTTPQTTPCRRY